MKKILTEVLSNFSDRELAFFYSYRLLNLQENIKKEIEEYIIKQRNLDREKIEQLIIQKLNHPTIGKEACRRCGYNNFEVNEKSKYCIVCGKAKHKNKVQQIICYLFDFIPV